MSRRFRFSRSFSGVAVALLISAGLTLRAQQPAASGPDRWEATIKQFEEQDRVNPPPRGEIVFTGASSIVRWNLPESFPDLKVINRGFGGSEMVDGARYASRIVCPTRLASSCFMREITTSVEAWRRKKSKPTSSGSSRSCTVECHRRASW